MTQETVVNIPITDHDNFSFAECLVFLGRSEKECLHYVQDGVVQKMIVSNGQPLLMEISDDAAAGSLRVMIRSTANGTANRALGNGSAGNGSVEDDLTLP